MNADDRTDPHALRTARSCIDGLVRAGASAIVLTGSHARGDARPESDIDLHAIGIGPTYQLIRREPFLISISWRTAEQHRASFDDVEALGGAVPAWRSAVVLHDPDGIASELQREAQSWSWDRIDADRLNAFVADCVYGFAEEVHKLSASRAAGQATMAAVQRSVLALRLALPMALYHRLLFDTENLLWDKVNARMGAAWTRAQLAAFGTDGESFNTSCDAALQLFAIASRTVWQHLTAEQRAVVAHACDLASHPLNDLDAGG